MDSVGCTVASSVVADPVSVVLQLSINQLKPPAAAAAAGPSHGQGRSQKFVWGV